MESEDAEVLISDLMIHDLETHFQLWQLHNKYDMRKFNSPWLRYEACSSNSSSDGKTADSCLFVVLTTQ